MMGIRRAIALWICPELAELPPSAPDAQYPQSKRPDWFRLAQELRKLDRLYAAATGVTLTLADGPAYFGGRGLDRYNALLVIRRLRLNRSGGVRPSTHLSVCQYFSHIWPASAPWPSDIHRPVPSREGAK